MKVQGQLYYSLKNNEVQCFACAHRCRIREGHCGICGVRKNEGGDLYLLVYGKASAINIDPIEKKPLFHFYPGISILSIGTVGCNFRCDFCQNAELSQFHKFHDEIEIMKAGQDFFPKKIVEYCEKEKIPAIAFTYNEPAIFFEYAYKIAKLAHAQGIKTVYVSNGFETPEALKKIGPYLDAINIDLKSSRKEFYHQICGGQLEPVKENIKWCVSQEIWTEVTNLKSQFNKK